MLGIKMNYCIGLVVCARRKMHKIAFAIDRQSTISYYPNCYYVRQAHIFEGNFVTQTQLANSLRCQSVAITYSETFGHGSFAIFYSLDCLYQCLLTSNSFSFPFLGP